MLSAIGSLLSRLMIAAIFLASAAGKTMDLDGVKAQITAAGMPLPTVALFGAISLELFGGVLIAVGLRTRLGALLLAIFLIPATYYFHFDLESRIQQIQLLKNVAIFGGLLSLMVHGPGALSMDGWKAARQSKG